MSVKDMVKNNQQVEFIKFDSDNLWYKAENGFMFPVPVADTGSAIFNPKDKALLFMRWIKKHLDNVGENTASFKEQVIENEQVNFVRFQQGDLWYVNNAGFEFPVSVRENKDAKFNKYESVNKVSGWIEKHLADIEKGKLNI